MGPKGGGPEGWGPEGGGPKGGRGERPKIPVFSLSRPKFHLFLLSLGSSRGIVVSVQGHTPLKVCVWASWGSFCVSPGDPKDQPQLQPHVQPQPEP